MTASYTLTAGDLLLAVVGIHDETNAPNSAVWNGSETMTLVGYLGNAGTRGAGLYALAGATSGTHDVVVTHATSETMALLVFGYSGVATSSPFDGAVTDAEATGDTSLSVSVTSPTGDKAIVVAASAGTGLTLTPTNGTLQNAQDTANFGFYILDRDGQGGATTISGTFGSDPFGFTTVGCNLNVPAIFGAGYLGHYYRSVVTGAV